MLQDDYEFYRTRSKAELWETLAHLTAQQKQNGELDDAAMEETYAMLAPMLSESQRSSLRQILDALK